MTTIERGHDYILWAAKYNKRIVLLSTLIISIHGLKLLSKQIVALLTIKGCSPSEAILFSETATKGGMCTIRVSVIGLWGTWQSQGPSVSWWFESVHFVFWSHLCL